jgi:phosphoribosylformylglycinamidine synthase
MQLVKGVNALSDFRAKGLLKQLHSVDEAMHDVSAEYVHFIHTDTELSAADEKRLAALLTYDAPYTGKRAGELYLVVPRPGTISPWSSKATDIAHNAGLEHIQRIERGVAYYIDSKKRDEIAPLLHDRMTESVLDSFEAAETLFAEPNPKPLITIDVRAGSKAALEKANLEQGLALSADEIEYLVDAYKKLGRNPSDAELMMFGQVNSEHCRHKIFNADWIVDGKKQPKSLFKMIRNTYEKGGEDVLSAYSDNAAVLRGPTAGRFFPDPTTHRYDFHPEPIHTVIKVETHNHPTAIAPFPGAATGTGGEIRDEGATGRGAKPKMGLAGFSVSNLNIPHYIQPWEHYNAPINSALRDAGDFLDEERTEPYENTVKGVPESKNSLQPKKSAEQPAMLDDQLTGAEFMGYGKPDRITSPLGIMLDAPLGGAAFANEFGRPNLAGYFRTYEQFDGENVRGYHKPIMIAGGLGNIRDQHVQKGIMRAGDTIVILGGPAMLIGLGGGAASSMQSGASHENLDFASVQRGNGEMERRAQEVIDACWASDDNPIVMIHDIGAGGYCNAVSELVHDAGLGAEIELRAIDNADPGMSPMEIWCNEAQERYVIGLRAGDVDRFRAICERERCPFTVIGTATAEDRLIVHDSLLGNDTVDLPMSTLFGKPPKMTRTFTRKDTGLHPNVILSSIQDLSGATTKSQTKPRMTADANWLENISIADAVKRVLHIPAVGSKKFLVTIGDRSITGLVTRDQMVGPWQVPVSDVAVTAAAFDTMAGEAMAMGERTPIAVTNAPASGRMAIAEAITNLLAADTQDLRDIKLSANWMAAAGVGTEDRALYDTVHAVGEEFCPALGLTIPVGKDSLSMRSTWQDGDETKSVTSPLSLIITGFTPVEDVSKTLTPQLDISSDSVLIYVDLSGGTTRLGGSALAQAYNHIVSKTPDADPEILKDFFAKTHALKTKNLLLAYHDRSDGGLFTTLAEMAFASRCGLDIDLTPLGHLGLTPECHPELDSGTPATDPRALFGEVLSQVQHDKGSARSGKSSAHHDMGSVLPEPCRGQMLQLLFNEELGVVIQVKTSDVKHVSQVLGDSAYVIGKPTKKQTLTFKYKHTVVYQNTRVQLEQWWAETSYHIQRLRDNPACADAEYAAILDDADPGLNPALESRGMCQESRKTYATSSTGDGHTSSASAIPTFSQSHRSETAAVVERARSASASEKRAEERGLDSSIAMNLPQEGRAPLRKDGTHTDKPQVAIFREQGVNGQLEMAAAFTRAGFTAIDVHLSDLVNNTIKLRDFSGLVACGGFSYGDVLGAGGGWAKTILFDKNLRTQFKAFFERPDTFTLGVCNGCQMLSELKELIPGAENWPKFLHNRSARFEARLPQIRLNTSPSIFFKGMEGSVLPIPVAHGEGYAEFATEAAKAHAVKSGLVAAQYVDNRHQPTETYPANPNGSPEGITALTTPDGRTTIMMPHPERAFQTRQLSWHPADWPEDSPWLQMFVNAYHWTQEIRDMS